ncbi:MAG TPA: hypothetical protein VJ046_00825 [Candidatus Paceibacterota bacterium]|nr:hypothetical protein [Candidatus Paceibacterota bacterium]
MSKIIKTTFVITLIATTLVLTVGIDWSDFIMLLAFILIMIFIGYPGKLEIKLFNLFEIKEGLAEIKRELSNINISLKAESRSNSNVNNVINMPNPESLKSNSTTVVVGLDKNSEV